MKHVEGFLAEDGTFFESSIDAELHDATAELDRACESHNIHPGDFRIGVREVLPQLMRYINAVQAKAEIEVGQRPERGSEVWRPKDEFDPTSDLDPGEHGGTTETFASIFEQQAGGDELVPNMGDGVSPEEIPDLSEGDGPGGGRGNAPSVRRRPNMATRTHSRVPPTRSGDGE